MMEFQPVAKKGIKVPKFSQVPKHIAIVMDGNGRWANKRGLPRVEGHKAGEAALLDVVAGAIEAGVSELSVFAFSTENWNKEVLRDRRDQLNNWGVKVRWVGRRPKLWASVIDELEEAQRMTSKNKVLTLTMCVNYGSRIEIVDTVNEITQLVAKKKLKVGSVTEKSFGKLLSTNPLKDVDLFIRSSGEKRMSNFLLWQSAYAELVFSLAGD
jgi:undecaprenyl diphosphate synthase